MDYNKILKKDFKVKHKKSCLGEEVIFFDSGEDKLGIVVASYLDDNGNNKFDILTSREHKIVTVDDDSIFNKEDKSFSIQESPAEIVQDIKSYCSDICLLECDSICPLQKFKNCDL